MIVGDCEITDVPGVTCMAGAGQFMVDETRVIAKDDAGLKARWLGSKPDGFVSGAALVLAELCPPAGPCVWHE